MIYVDPRDPCYLPDPEDREPDIFDQADEAYETEKTNHKNKIVMNEIELLVQVQSEPTTEKKKFTLPFFYKESEHSPTLIRIDRCGNDIVKTTVLSSSTSFCITANTIADKRSVIIPAKAIAIPRASFDNSYDEIVNRLISIETEK